MREKWILLDYIHGIHKYLRIHQTHHSYTCITYSQLWSLQISKDCNRVVVLFLNGANHIVESLLLFVRSVAEVEPKNVGTRKEELLNHLNRRRRGPKSDNLLGRLAPTLRYLGDGGNGERGRVAIESCRLQKGLGRRERGLGGRKGRSRSDERKKDSKLHTVVIDLYILSTPE